MASSKRRLAAEADTERQTRAHPSMAPTRASLRVAAQRVRAALEARADPRRAEGMRRYLKSALPCLGVRVPQARAVAVECFGDRTFDALTDLEPLVRTLWDSAAFREERFVALGILRLPAARRLMSAKAQPLFEHLILTGAWWDLVDELSTHVVARALDHDVAMAGVVRTWAHSEALWLKRAALVCQVVRGSKTDVALLEEVIEASLGGTDFFLRKGIGWAMRSLARHHPSVVRRWLQRWRRQLSPLSVREAKKGLVRSKKAPR